MRRNYLGDELDEFLDLRLMDVGLVSQTVVQFVEAIVAVGFAVVLPIE